MPAFIRRPAHGTPVAGRRARGMVPKKKAALLVIIAARPLLCVRRRRLQALPSPPPPREDDVTRRRHGCVASVARHACGGVATERQNCPPHHLRSTSTNAREHASFFLLSTTKREGGEIGRSALFTRPLLLPASTRAAAAEPVTFDRPSAEETKGKANAATIGATRASNPRRTLSRPLSHFPNSTRAGDSDGTGSLTQTCGPNESATLLIIRPASSG